MKATIVGTLFVLSLTPATPLPQCQPIPAIENQKAARFPGLCDRILNRTPNTAVALAHVMAREIVHFLEGFSGHSEGRLMTAREHAGNALDNRATEVK